MADFLATNSITMKQAFSTAKCSTLVMSLPFQGTTVKELRKAFRESVEDYLAFCKERGEEPDKPLSGQFMTRVDPELHRQISQSAGLAGMSLNAWVNEKLSQAVGQVRKRESSI